MEKLALTIVQVQSSPRQSYKRLELTLHITGCHAEDGHIIYVILRKRQAREHLVHHYLRLNMCIF